MIKCINILWLQLALVCYVNAQKYDANWVFGRNAGIHFNVSNNPTIFKSDCKVLENAACVSSFNGDLNFYLTNLVDTFGQQVPYYCNIIDNSGLIIDEGDSINAWISSTNGAIVLPIGNQGLFYYVFHIGYTYSLIGQCFPNNCLKLYYSIIKKVNNRLFIQKKNVLLEDITVFERISITRHANGIDWWLITNTHVDSIGYKKNRFYKWLIEDSVINPSSFQDIPTKSNGGYDLSGQMQFSNTGNILGLISSSSSLFEVYDFNRCSGELTLRIDKVMSDFGELYGFEFSKNDRFMYISSFDSSSILQVDLNNPQLNIRSIYSTNKFFGQLQLANDGKIYVANQNSNTSNEYVNNIFNQYNQNLSVINQPDSAGLTCDFIPFSFYLGDSSKSSLGLPNFPNYNLGALSIYEADAGNDTLICTDSTINQKVVQLGSPTINGVQYQWYPNYNLSSNTSAQPLAFPDTSTIYYVMLSDTSIKNACKTRLDSVLVEVKNCVTGVYDPQTPKGGLRVYPNPAREEINLSINNQQSSIKEVKVYDVAGRAIIYNIKEAKGQYYTLDIAAVTSGLYFIEVMLSNGSVERVKFIKQ